MIELKPLNPTLHAAYAPILAGEAKHVPSELRAQLDELTAKRLTASDSELDAIDRAIVAIAWPCALRPNEIAREVIRHHGLPRVLSVGQAALVLAAIGEAGYPITGNGAPDYYDRHASGALATRSGHPPVRGPERDEVLWAAALYWARMASQHITYVSLGDARGYGPRPVQYDQPGSMHPSQQASLTLGPAEDTRSHAYMRRHTRRLLLVRGES